MILAVKKVHSPAGHVHCKVHCNSGKKIPVCLVSLLIVRRTPFVKSKFLLPPMGGVTQKAAVWTIRQFNKLQSVQTGLKQDTTPHLQSHFNADQEIPGWWDCLHSGVTSNQGLTNPSLL